MLKSAIVIIIVSAVAMFFQSELGHVLRYLLAVHDKIADGLAVAFSNAPAGRIIQETIALMIIPVVIGAAVALAWFMVKRNEIPHLVATAWIIWTILLVTVLLQPSTHRGTNQKTAAQVHKTVYY